MPHARASATVSACLLAAAMARAGVAHAATPSAFQPAMEGDFPDAFVLQQGDRYLAYATNPGHGGVNVQMATSADLASWQMLRDGNRLHDAMPTLPPWAQRGFTWAPEVMKIGDRYVLYFTARDRKSHLQCIGAAAAADPAGPFVSTATEPLVCQTDQGGSIDPDPFRDADGKLILYFKDDGNNPDFHQPTRIYAQELTADGLGVTGPQVPLLVNDAAWEGRVIEAPTMVRRNGGYTLFFSANDYGWTEPRQRLSPYAIGYATCRTAMGPCAAAPENPILSSRLSAGDCLSGPGHQSVLQVGTRWYMTFHAWQATAQCHSIYSRRRFYITPLGWNGDRPVIGGAEGTPAP